MAGFRKRFSTVSLTLKSENTMNVLVVGATGATGRLVVSQLLERGQSVRVIVRSPSSLPEFIRSHDRVTIVNACVLDLSNDEMAQHVTSCTAVVLCLGHTMSLKGIYGHPRRLVADATLRLCNAIKSNQADWATKFVLMNTAANNNRNIHEPISFGQQCVIALLRLLLPPHVDNERAADYLRMDIGQQDKSIEWVVVRPDTLTNEKQVTEYEVLHSPTRSAIFNAGVTSRINLARFMADLVSDSEVWSRWKGTMPVIYNKASA